MLCRRSGRVLMYYTVIALIVLLIAVKLAAKIYHNLQTRRYARLLDNCNLQDVSSSELVLATTHHFMRIGQGVYVTEYFDLVSARGQVIRNYHIYHLIELERVGFPALDPADILSLPIK